MACSRLCYYLSCGVYDAGRPTTIAQSPLKRVDVFPVTTTGAVGYTATSTGYRNTGVAAFEGKMQGTGATLQSPRPPPPRNNRQANAMATPANNPTSPIRLLSSPKLPISNVGNEHRAAPVRRVSFTANSQHNSAARSEIRTPSATTSSPPPAVNKNNTPAPPKGGEDGEFWFAGDETTRRKLANASPAPGDALKAKSNASVVAKAFSPGAGGLKAKLPPKRSKKPGAATPGPEEGADAEEGDQEDGATRRSNASSTPGPAAGPTPGRAARGRGRGRGRGAATPGGPGRYFGGTFIPETEDGEANIYLDESALRRMAPLPVEDLGDDDG